MATREAFLQDISFRALCGGYGVLRGLHLQYRNSQGKLVTVLHGHVMDVVVDARRGSPSLG